MADTIRLAGAFEAWRLTVGVDPRFLGSAIKLCRDMGLRPDVCGFKGERVLFRVLVPCSAGLPGETSQHLFVTTLSCFKIVPFGAEKTQLICPVSME